MSRVLKLTCEFEPNQGWMWQIRGLPYWDWYEKREYNDTRFPLVGMYHACDTPESVVAGVYRALYDYHQTTEKGYGFQDGDSIVSEPVAIYKYHSYDFTRGTVHVPAMKFKVISYHIVQEEPEFKDE